LLGNHPFLYYWFTFLGIILGRYFLVAGGTHILIHSLLRQLLARRGIRIDPPAWKSIRRDIKLSILSTVIFAFGAAFAIYQFDRGSTLLYANVDKHGYWYLGLSFVGVLLLQDTYFYFIHRLFHHPLLFHWLHRGHHLSGQPTPWTSFAFDPAEAIFQVLFLVAIVFTIPLHFATIIAIITTMTIWSVINHLGFPLFPASGWFRWCGRWAIGPLHHAVHHRKHIKHYGLYFTFWDRLLGTHEPNYHRVNSAGKSIELAVLKN
jgi:sterol desaturase/sphingolipid hydroxylase (fatty acid hydroxylase superfamily)